MYQESIKRKVDKTFRTSVYENGQKTKQLYHLVDNRFSQPLQFGGRAKKTRSKGSYFVERIVAGADRYSIIASGVSGILASAIAHSCFRLPLPLGWGLGVGLGVGILMSYLRGERNIDRKWGLLNYDETQDDDYLPSNVFHARRCDIIRGIEPRTELEEEAHTYETGIVRKSVGPGMVSWRPSRRQIFVQSRKEDYDGARVGVDYDSLTPILDRGTSEEIEERGEALLLSSRGESVDFSKWSDEERRAGAHLLAITQVAEEHSTRTQGSALLARGGFKAISDGTATFADVFGRDGGLYAPAHRGGTKEMREIGSKSREPDPLISGLCEGL